MDIIDAGVRTKLFKLFDIPLDDFKSPYTTKYERLLPDAEICLIYSHHSNKYLIFYIEDFPKPYEEIVKIVEKWHNGTILKTHRPYVPYPGQFHDDQLQKYATSINPEAQSNLVLLFEVSTPVVKKWYYQ